MIGEKDTQEFYRERLEHLHEDERGKLSRENGEPFPNIYAFKVSGLKTLIITRIFEDISDKINRLAKENSPFIIPKEANAFVASEWNQDTIFTRNCEVSIVYAIQFYQLLIYKSE